MPGNKTNYFNCVVCSKRTKAIERREVSRAIKQFLRKAHGTVSVAPVPVLLVSVPM